MIKLYHSPLTRSVRILWLLEELGLPYELETREFADPAPTPFAQKTPSGKFPTLEDGEVVLFESGAILEYILERYGEGRLAPGIGSPLRARFLQWIHFSESTAFAGLGNIAWHTRFRQNADEMPQAMEDYRGWAAAAFDQLERELEGRPFILGDEFSGADVMLGYTVLVGRAFGILGEGYANLDRYLTRLTARPALQKALRP